MKANKPRRLSNLEVTSRKNKQEQVDSFYTYLKTEIGSKTGFINNVINYDRFIIGDNSLVYKIGVKSTDGEY